VPAFRLSRTPSELQISEDKPDYDHERGQDQRHVWMVLENLDEHVSSPSAWGQRRRIICWGSDPWGTRKVAPSGEWEPSSRSRGRLSADMVNKPLISRAKYLPFKMKRGEQSAKRKGPFTTHCEHWRCLTNQGPGSRGDDVRVLNG
jgi:hypothetical protein